MVASYCLWYNEVFIVIILKQIVVGFFYTVLCSFYLLESCKAFCKEKKKMLHPCPMYFGHKMMRNKIKKL